LLGILLKATVTSPDMTKTALDRKHAANTC
jgi:hypothetical protein